MHPWELAPDSILVDRRDRLAYRQYLQSLDPHCLYCGRYLTRGATLDHVQPVSRGGSHRTGNLVLACPVCNVAKGNRTPPEWLADLQQACQRLRLLRSESGVIRVAL